MECWFCGSELVLSRDVILDECCCEGEGVVSFLFCPECMSEVHCVKKDDEVMFNE